MHKPIRDLAVRLQWVDRMPFQKILCPVDFSLGSQQAMLLAIRLANEAAAELVLAHVWYLPPLVYAEDPPFPADTLQAMIEDERRGLAAAAAEASRLGARGVTTKFSPVYPGPSSSICCKATQRLASWSWERMAAPAWTAS